MTSAQEKLYEVINHPNLCPCRKSICKLIEKAKMYIDKYKLTEFNPVMKHYKECVWSDPLCLEGPDTCVCSLFDLTLDQAMTKLNKGVGCCITV